MGVFLESKNIQVIMKTICVLLALVAAASAFQQCGKKGSGSRIINGVDAGHGEFPWQISLRFGRYGHICGGTLIGHQYVLCAAHCFGQTKNPAAYTVRVGEWYLKRGDGTEKDFRVSEVHVHESYNRPKQFNNDIALMKLATPVDFSGPYAGPACLAPAGKYYRGTQNCMLSGWGLVKRYPQTLADRLQKVTGRIWGARELLRQYWSLPDHVVGFGEPSKGWSACMGDWRPPRLPQRQRHLRRHRCRLLRSRHLLWQTRCLHRGFPIQRMAFREAWWSYLSPSQRFLLVCFLFSFF